MACFSSGRVKLVNFAPTTYHVGKTVLWECVSVCAPLLIPYSHVRTLSSLMAAVETAAHDMLP